MWRKQRLMLRILIVTGPILSNILLASDQLNRPNSSAASLTALPSASHSARAKSQRRKARQQALAQPSADPAPQTNQSAPTALAQPATPTPSAAPTQLAPAAAVTAARLPTTPE